MKSNIEKVILLTAFRGEINTLIKSININISQLNPQDIWIVVLDNLDVDLKIFKQFNEQLILLKYSGDIGAGYARNYGLDYIIHQKINNFLLWPIDGDYHIINGSRNFFYKDFENEKVKIISYGMIKVTEKRSIKIGYSGVLNFHEALKKYKTPCGSTILRISSYKLLKKFRFSKRKRANDQLFFLSAIKEFNQIYFKKEPIFLYNVSGKNGLSRTKWKMPIYKFLALKDMKINLLKSFFYFFLYLKDNTFDKLFIYLLNLFKNDH